MATAIAWTSETWNPVHGCSRVSEGCRHCYAETLSLRYGHTKKPWTFGNSKENVTLKPHKLKEPYSHKRPQRFFVNSMSDLFHEEIPVHYLHKVFDVMNDLPRHRFQILTKRAERLVDLAHHFEWTPNIWMGVTVENERSTFRIDLLRRVPAHVRFISFEPLITEIPNPDLSDIHWAIAGGESGKGHRPMPHAWARTIRDACLEQRTAFFFKQSAGYRTELDVALQHEDGTYWLWQQFPDHVRKPLQVPRQINGSELGLYIIEDVEEQHEKEEVISLFD